MLARLIPYIPFFPTFAKNISISFPDAKPAPMIVPIITQTAFIISPHKKITPHKFYYER